MTPVMKGQELLPGTGYSQSEDSDSENGCCTMETCKGQLLTGSRSDSLHLITWAVTDASCIRNDARLIRFGDR